MAETNDHAAFMRRALELARGGRGVTHPNPMVGAVIVRDGRVVGEGFHREYGAPHAEVEALRAAGPAARGATLYVTLEPCAHHGRTPPCVDAIIDAGIARVVFAAADPNRTAAGGAQRLRDAGIEVDDGVERAAARSLNAPFFHAHERPHPFIALKLAISLDGRIAAAPGTRTQLTGPEAQEEAHRLRAMHGAILVGSGTARADDPLLTVRGVPVRQPPLRVVLDSDASLPTHSQLVGTARDVPLLVLCAEDAPAPRVDALREAGAQVLRLARNGDGLDLAGVRTALGDAGIRDVLVEGGAGIATTLVERGLADRIYLFVAPIFLGTAGVLAFNLPDARSGWHCARVDRPGADVMLTLDRVRAR